MIAVLTASLIEPIACDDALRDYFEEFSGEDYQIVDTPYGSLLTDCDVETLNFDLPSSGKTIFCGNIDPQLILASAHNLTTELVVASPEKHALRLLYWTLMLNRISGAKLYHTSIPPDEDLRSADLMIVSPELLGEGNRFLWFLKPVGANPNLLLDLDYGLDIEHSDPFIKEVREDRLETLKTLGYTLSPLPPYQFAQKTEK